MILFLNIHLLSFGFLDFLIAVCLKSPFIFFLLPLAAFLKITYFDLEYLDLVLIFKGLSIVTLASFYSPQLF
jgi:hypothetical protein